MNSTCRSAPWHISHSHAPPLPLGGLIASSRPYPRFGLLVSYSACRLIAASCSGRSHLYLARSDPSSHIAHGPALVIASL